MQPKRQPSEPTISQSAFMNASVARGAELHRLAKEGVISDEKPDPIDVGSQDVHPSDADMPSKAFRPDFTGVKIQSVDSGAPMGK